METKFIFAFIAIVLVIFLYIKNKYKPTFIVAESLFGTIIANEYKFDKTKLQNENRARLVNLLEKHNTLIEDMIHYCVIKKSDEKKKGYYVSDYIKKEFIKVDQKSQSYYVHIESIIDAVNNPKQPSLDRIIQLIDIDATDKAFVELGKLMYEEAKKPSIESMACGPGWL